LAKLGKATLAMCDYFLATLVYSAIKAFIHGKRRAPKVHAGNIATDTNIDVSWFGMSGFQIKVI